MKIADDIRPALTAHMARLVAAAQLRQGPVTFTRPCISPTYQGVWPDDCMWPFIADPLLAKSLDWSGLLNWLTDAIVDLPCVPDRVEFSGLAVMSPGPVGASPLSMQMPLHLPSAWTRFLDYASGFGYEIPRKEAWGAVIRRSFDRVPFSFGLVYSDPQEQVVGFGFYDTVRLTGLDLMTSVVTYRGLQRAAALFADVMDPAVCEQWRQRAEHLRANLHRLYDEEAGGFVGGTSAGRMFSVWGNGLVYPLATRAQQAGILRFICEHQKKIFIRGCTRQTATLGGWSGASRGYQDSGAWAAGTGFILPALAVGAPELARSLAGELMEQLDSFECAEWLDDQGSPQGARQFLASVSMPLLALRSIEEGKPLLDYF